MAFGQAREKLTGRDFSLMYISFGNVPSQAANSLTTVKTAQALAGLLPRTELVTGGDVASLFGGDRFDYQAWYGLTRPLKITRLPLALKLKRPMPINFRPRFYPQAAARYARLKRPDAVYTRSVEIFRRCLKAGLKVILEHHGLAEGLDWAGLMADPRAAAGLIGLVVNHPLMAPAHRQAGLPAERILVSGLGVDLDQFPAGADRFRLRAGLGLPGDLPADTINDRPLAVYAGHLYDHQGIADIIGAAALLPEVNFVLVGGWPGDAARWRAEAEAQDLGNVFILGHRPQAELPRYLQAADVLLLTYRPGQRHTGWITPTKMYEYLAAGRPMVASALPALKPFLHDGQNALLVEPAAPAALAGAITRLLDDPDLARNLADRARQEVTGLTWDARAKALVDWIGGRLDSLAKEAG